MSFVDALLPPTLARCARRIGTVLIALGVLVLFLFPDSARAGTEVPADRWLTGGLLVAAGLGMRLAARRSPATAVGVLLAHGVAHAIVGGHWAAVLSAVLVAYAAGSWLRDRVGAPAASPGVEGAAADAAPDAAPQHPADVARENVEAIVMALIIALTVREFLYEAFLIPTASMEPTIVGQEPSEGRKHGDRLLATKIPMLTGDPPRWSIVVFKYPLYRRVNYIKRLIGLPGETVEIRDGDIYVNDAVVAKPEEVQDQLWFPEYPVPGSPPGAAAVWKPRDVGAAWSVDDTAASADVASGTESWIAYDQTLDRRDNDLRVGALLDISRLDPDAGAVLLRVEGAGRAVELEVGASGARLSAPGLDRVPVDGVALGRGARRIDLGVADRVVRVWVDGRLAARIAHADEQNDGSDRPKVALGLRGAAARLSGLRVDRYLQYGKAGYSMVPDDGFVMLGDNTDSSKDSREWRVIELVTADGRVFHTENHVKLEDNSIVSFQERDGVYRFIDVDGIARELDAATTEKRVGVAAPYVRRRDLVGRAFVIFFPFPPFGDFRLRFLP